MRNLFRACHKVYEIKYHLVFVVKYRKDLFLEEKYCSGLKEILKQLEERFFFQFECIGFDEDHVHLLTLAAPRYSPSKIICIVKSLTARELFKRFPEIKRQLWGGEFWSDGGYIGTVGEGANADIIRKYIKRQGMSGTQLKLSEFAEP